MRSVQAGVASIMCSYSTSIAFILSHRTMLSSFHAPLSDLVNDTFACENNKTLNGMLKSEFGFQGYVMSDWGAQHSTMSAVAGLDVRQSLCFFHQGS